MKTIIYFILIFGAVFSDCPTGIYFGMIGRCWLFLFVPFCFIFMVLNFKIIHINKFIRCMVNIIIWIILSSVVSNIFYMIHNGNSISFGENLWVKSFKSLSYWIVIFMYLSCVYECVYYMTKREIIFPFFISFIFLFIVLIFELFQMPYAFTQFHFNNFLGGYDRVRLTTTESSLTIPLIVCYGLLSVYYTFYLSKYKCLRLMVVIMLFVFVYTSGSKTLLLIYAVGMTAFLWVNRKKINRKILIPVTVLVVVCAISLPSLITNLWNRMTMDGGSTAIRIIQILAAVIHSFKFPCGNGGGAYMQTYQHLLVRAYEWIRDSFFGDNLRYVGILEQINSESDVWGVIAGIWQLAMYIGILGVIYWLSFTKKYLKNLFRNQARGVWTFKVMIICTITMWFFAIPMWNVYYLWAAILISGLDVFVDKHI